MEMQTYHNPVLKGFHSDPSICIVGEDAYMVVSTFEFFPGVPIYHSKNLVDWTLINYCLPTSEHLNLEQCKRSSGGIFAPSIRYNDGTFYMITTNISDKGNFIVSTKDIYGEWTKPVWIDHKGIDPSLLFDDDGKVYFCGTGSDDKGVHGLVAFEINPDTGEILSEKKVISRGCGGKFPEGPHIYHINDYYYLMLAEGGTEYGHMQTILRSKSVWGPYEECPHNPILSNKDNMYVTVQCAGHADMFKDVNDNWWLICHAVRHLDKGLLFHNLGREDFLVPMVWENGWPKVGTDKCAYETMEGPLPGPKQLPQAGKYDFFDDFSGDKLDLNWNFAKVKKENSYTLENNALIMRGGSEKLNDDFPIFMGVRQPEFNLNVETQISVDDLQEGAEAGLVAYYAKENHYALCLVNENGEYYAVLRKRVMDMVCVEEKVKISGTQNIKMKLQTSKSEYTFFVSQGNEDYVKVGSGKTSGLCTEGTVVKTFTGNFSGLFAVNITAKFDYFSIKEIVE